jgi:TetR/AcrR family transcriptional repressor of lmrAB and yxaGH operons
MIAAMAKLLRVQGYHATGLNQITLESNTPKGSLYFHFPGGKEELAITAVQAAGQEDSQRITAVLSSQDNIADAVSTLLLVLAQRLQTSDFQDGNPVTAVAVETAATHESLRQGCEQIYRTWHALIEQRLRSAGFAALQAEAWATLILSSIEGALVLSRTQRDIKPLEIVAEQLRSLLAQIQPGTS